MPTVEEALAARTILGAPLAAGVDTVSLKQVVTFDLYVQVVLPSDGYVFWVKASAMTASALYNASALNSFAFNQAASVPPTLPAIQFKAMGSLHYATDSRQDDDANYATNRVIFTSLVPMQDMNAIGPQFLYIGTFDAPPLQLPDEPTNPISRANSALYNASALNTFGLNQSAVSTIPDPPEPIPFDPRGTTAIKFAFSSRGSFYQQADLWHYVGFAVYPFMSTQIVDDPRFFQTGKPIVSNSMPLWLAFSHYNPPWPVPVPRPAIQFYPAMLSPDNAVLPFATVKIDDTITEQSAPSLDRFTNANSLCRETVALTIFGTSNAVAQDILQSLLQYSYDTGDFGVTNMPTIVDPRVGQNEMNVLAQKKIITFEVSYNQSTVRKLARQLIEHCLVTVQVGDQVIPST